MLISWEKRFLSSFNFLYFAYSWIANVGLTEWHRLYRAEPIQRSNEFTYLHLIISRRHLCGFRIFVKALFSVLSNVSISSYKTKFHFKLIAWNLVTYLARKFHTLSFVECLDIVTHGIVVCILDLKNQKEENV